ncbi:MAG: type II toxin-antitoxin system RelE/ParE family toxin [Verrucomicrobiia bacterium]|jgi:mRNA interferase RelE/StbE
MAYTVILKRSAERELDRLPAQLHDRITRKLLELEDDPRPHGVQKLHGQDRYRIRIGDYRVLYIIDDRAQTVEIVAVGHRRDVYR